MDCSWRLYTRNGQLQSAVFVFKSYICFACSEIVADNVLKPLKYFFYCSEFVLKRFRKRPCQGNKHVTEITGSYTEYLFVS